MFCHFTEIGEGTEGKVDNACNSQTHSTPHRAQCETNHTSIPAHTHSTDETHQDGASCHGDKGAKLGVQKNGLTSMAEKGSNSEQKCKGKSSYTEVVGTQSGRNEDSESSVEDEDQSEDVKSLGGKGGKRVKTCSITRSDTDARDHRDEAVQEGEKITLDENHRGKSDCNSLPKGNEQKNKSDGAIPGVKDEKPDHKSGCNDTEKSPSVNESNIDDVAMQEAKIENHDQNSELKHTSKRPVGNENDIDEGAMQRARDEKHDQNNGNKDIDNRPGRNEKDTDNKIRPSVENENNGDGDTEERPMKYEKNDKGDITTEAVKEESPDVNKKINNTKKEFRENEKKDHPYNGTTKDQDDKTKSISQARNLELSDKTASVLGDPDKPFDDSDGGTKESEDKGALPETTPLTQTAQPCNQMDYYACHQDEVGATHSEASHETSSSSQSQDDYTILDKQLDGLINEIFTESNLKESIEERKKSAREKLKSFFLAKVMDGSLSQRSHYPCATKSMPLQIFDSDIHITGKFTLSFPSICYTLDTRYVETCIKENTAHSEMEGNIQKDT